MNPEAAGVGFSRAGKRETKPRWNAVHQSEPHRENGVRAVKGSSTARAPQPTREMLNSRHPRLDDHTDFNESDESIRMRVRQRIQQRVQELQASSGQSDIPIALCGSECASKGENRVIETLHEDVVLTAAQILERYLEKNQRDDSLELTLVHRMLVKEVELQALQRQRGMQKNT